MREPAPSPTGRVSEAATLDVAPWSTGEIVQVPTPNSATSRGRYVVLEEVAPDRPGHVQRAYDPKLRREVVLKVLRADRPGDAKAARMHAEARAMARLSHPNVVAVYDLHEHSEGGVTLVTEYIAGTTLKAWIHAQPRDWRQVIDRFAAAGRGLSAAHWAGLVHGNFSPRSVLVGAAGVVKVAGFGLTFPDRNAIAPEQHRGEQPTPAADQYALCVALWETLGGGPPFAGPALVADKERGPGAWPQAGQSIPAPIARAIRRGLSPAPSDRWPNIAALLDALSVAPTRRYRWAAALAGVLTLGAGATLAIERPPEQAPCTGAAEQLHGVWDKTRRGEVEAAILGINLPFADQVWERSSIALDEYAGRWQDMHTEACLASTVRGEQSAAVMDLQIGCLQRAKLDLTAVAEVLADADAKVVAKAHATISGLPALDRCTDIEALQADEEPPMPEEADAVEAIRGLLAQARATARAGRYEAAHEAVQTAISAQAPLTYIPIKGDVAFEQGESLSRLGKHKEAEAALRRSLAMASHMRRSYAASSALSRLVASVGAVQGRIEEGRQFHELSKGLAQGHPFREHDVVYNQAASQLVRGDYAAAESTLREGIETSSSLLSPESQEVLSLRVLLAWALESQGKRTAAVSEYRDVIAIGERTLGPDHPAFAIYINNLALVLIGLDRFEEAARHLHKVLRLWNMTFEPNSAYVAGARTNLALCMQGQGKFEEAEAEFRAAIELLETSLGPDHHFVANQRNGLSGVLYDQGKFAESEVEAVKSLAIWERVFNPDHPSAGEARSTLAKVMAAQGRFDDATTESRRALAILTAAHGSQSASVARTRANLAGFLLSQGKTEEALILAEQAWGHSERDDLPAGERGATARTLAEALWLTEPTLPDGRARALALAERALADLERAGPRFTSQAKETRVWLAHARRR